MSAVRDGFWPWFGTPWSPDVVYEDEVSSARAPSSVPSDKEPAQNQAANQDPDDDEDMFGNIFDAAAFGIDEAEVGHRPGVPDGAAAAGAAAAAAAGASAPAASDDAGPAPEAPAEASAELLFHAALVIQAPCIFCIQQQVRLPMPWRSLRPTCRTCD